MLGYIQSLHCEQIIIPLKLNKVQIGDLLSESNNNNEPHNIIELIVFPQVILKQWAWCYLYESSSTYFMAIDIDIWNIHFERKIKPKVYRIFKAYEQHTLTSRELILQGKVKISFLKFF